MRVSVGEGSGRGDWRMEQTGQRRTFQVLCALRQLEDVVMMMMWAGWPLRPLALPCLALAQTWRARERGSERAIHPSPGVFAATHSHRCTLALSASRCLQSPSPSPSSTSTATPTHSRVTTPPPPPPPPPASPSFAHPRINRLTRNN